MLGRLERIERDIEVIAAAPCALLQGRERHACEGLRGSPPAVRRAHQVLLTLRQHA